MINKQIKKVNKHWGYELWIADGTITPYALKKIKFNQGNRTSLQVHRYKFETNYVLSGTGSLLISKEKFNIDKFLVEGMSINDILEYEKSLIVHDLFEGTVFNVAPGYVHRVIALTDLVFIESSTTELDDVIRLHDDANRAHGKIQKEHE